MLVQPDVCGSNAVVIGGLPFTPAFSNYMPVGGPDQGPWRTIDDVELATLGWVHWHNTRRLHGYLDDIPPADFEAVLHAQHTDQHLVGTQ